MTNNEKELYSLHGMLDAINACITEARAHDNTVSFEFLAKYRDNLQRGIFFCSQEVKAYNHQIYLNQKQKRSKKQ